MKMMDLCLSDLDEVLPLLFAGADGLFNAAELAEDGLCFIQFVVGLTAGHLPVNSAQHNTQVNKPSAMWLIF